MKKPREPSTEVICPACDGTGLQKVKQPTQPGRKVYPPKCAECLGKGRIQRPAAKWVGSIRGGHQCELSHRHLPPARPWAATP